MAAFTLFTLVASLLLGLVSTQSNLSATYTNPIVPGTGGKLKTTWISSMDERLTAPKADPWVTQWKGNYHMTFTNGANITILRSGTLTDWSNADVKLAFNPPKGMPYSTDLWAPELHNINGKWYVIFTADPSSDTPPPEIDMLCPFSCPAVLHRMYVLESSGADPWVSNYTLKPQVDTFDQFAIDGTYFQHSTGLYHVYSCWDTAYSSWPSNLCITKMSDPWTVVSNVTQRQTISVPSNPWEKTPYGRAENYRLSSNEGPEQLTNPQTGQQFIIYSAARSDNRNYCLGQLELVGDDPMNAQDW